MMMPLPIFAVFTYVRLLLLIIITVSLLLTDTVCATDQPPLPFGLAATVHNRSSPPSSSSSSRRQITTPSVDRQHRADNSLPTPVIGCPSRCRCPDHHSTVVNCHHAGLRRVPFPLPTGTIVLDLDQNSIGVLSNDSFGGMRSTSNSDDDSVENNPEQLEIVSVQDNGLVRIEPGAFTALGQLRILRLGGNLLSVLPVGLFDTCRRLQVLDVHDNLLTGAPPDHVMYHVHGLVSFNISRNRLTSPVLGSGFRYVTQLGDIDMSGNDFPTIEANTFSVMRYWDERVERRINLSACNLRRLHPAALLPVRWLRSISFAGNPHLPIDEIRACLSKSADVTSHLETLDISWNGAFRLSGNPSELSVSSGHDGGEGTVLLSRVTDLNLAGNRIFRIYNGTFDSLIGATVSSTAMAVSKTDPTAAFGDQSPSVRRGLLNLDLSWNHLQTAGEGLTEVGETVERLRLSGNRISDVDGQSSGFDELRRLLTLDLSHNELSQIGTGSALHRGPTNLRELDVSYNRIQSIGDDALPVGLEFLNVAGNRLTDVQFLRRLPRLRSVDLSQNAVARIDADTFASVAFGFPPPHFGGDVASNVYSNHPPAWNMAVNLSHNKIAHVAPDAFRRISFEVLDLSENELTELSHYGWYSVDVLFADSNELVTVDADVTSGIEGPREFYIRRNRLSNLPTPAADAIVNRSGTATSDRTGSRMLLLDISDNPDMGPFLERPIESGLRIGFGLQQLEVLRAQRINLRNVPFQLIDHFRSLRVLDISENHIKLIFPTAASSDVRKSAVRTLSHLHEIDLSGNRMTQFPIDLLSGGSGRQAVDLGNVGGLRIAHLAGNPWRCDCSTLRICQLPVIQLLLRNDAVAAVTGYSDDVDGRRTNQTQCEFSAMSYDDVGAERVSVTLVDFCRNESLVYFRCAAVNAESPKYLNVNHATNDVMKWRLALGCVIILTGLIILPAAALTVCYFRNGCNAGRCRRRGRNSLHDAGIGLMRRLQRQQRHGRGRDCASFCAGSRRTKSAGYRIVDETLHRSEQRPDDLECLQPL